MPSDGHVIVSCGRVIFKEDLGVHCLCFNNHLAPEVDLVCFAHETRRNQSAQVALCLRLVLIGFCRVDLPPEYVPRRTSCRACRAQHHDEIHSARQTQRKVRRWSPADDDTWSDPFLEWQMRQFWVQLATGRSFSQGQVTKDCVRLVRLCCGWAVALLRSSLRIYVQLPQLGSECLCLLCGHTRGFHASGLEFRGWQADELRSCLGGCQKS